MDHGPNKILVYPIQKYGDQCSGQSSIIILFLTEYFGLSLVSFLLYNAPGGIDTTVEEILVDNPVIKFLFYSTVFVLIKFCYNLFSIIFITLIKIYATHTN